MCNPNFKIDNDSCESIPEIWGDLCEADVEFLVYFSYDSNFSYDSPSYGNSNINDTLETVLQCPRSESFPCGCGPEGAADLNELYAAEKAGLRKTAVSNTMMSHMKNNE